MGATKLMTAAGGGITLDAASTASDKTITVPARTGNMAVDGPAFSAYCSTAGAISFSSSTWTKVPFNAEEFDTNSNYDHITNYRFQPTVAGYYQMSAGIYTYSTAPSIRACALYKNGSVFKRGWSATSSPPTEGMYVYSGLVYLNGSTDYVEMYVFDNGTSPNFYPIANPAHLWFSGVLTRAA
jgi:hypothetical protein